MNEENQIPEHLKTDCLLPHVGKYRRNCFVEAKSPIGGPSLCDGKKTLKVYFLA